MYEYCYVDNNSSKVADKFSNQAGYKFPNTPYQGIV